MKVSIFSIVLDTSGKSEIVWYFYGPSSHLFIIGFNLTILHSSGKVDCFINKFIIFFKGRANILAPSFRNVAGIWSISAALLVSRLSKIFLITSSDNFDSTKLLDLLHEVLVYQLWLFGQSIIWVPLAGFLQGLQLIQNIIFRNV